MARSSSPRPSAPRRIQDVPFSINAQTQEDIQRANASTIEDISRNVAGLDRPEPRAGPKPGLGPRRVRRADRPRPAGRQGTGRRLPRRIGHLAVAVHPRLRPVRPQPRRNAARSAGHLVRIGQRRRHAPLHHQPAQARPAPKGWSKPTSTPSRKATSAATSRARSTCRWATPPRSASSATARNLPASSMRSARRAARTSTTAAAPAAAFRCCGNPARSSASPRASSISRSAPTASTARRSSTSTPIR